jgi:hypothetical protein
MLRNCSDVCASPKTRLMQALDSAILNALRRTSLLTMMKVLSLFCVVQGAAAFLGHNPKAPSVSTKLNSEPYSYGYGSPTTTTRGPPGTNDRVVS